MTGAQRRYSSQAAACAYIRRRMDEAGLAAGGHLPGVRRLAADGGFCVTTCRKALRALAAEGRCVVMPRAGILAAPASGLMPALLSTAPDERFTRRSRSEDVRERLSEDILAGAHQPGTLLPQVKELTRRYRASYRVLAAALRALEADGRLVREGRGFRVPLPAPRTSSTVVLIAHADSLLDLVVFTPRNVEYLHCLERRCTQSGLRLQFLSFRDAVFWTTRAREVFHGRDAQPVVGVLVWSLGLIAGDMERLAVSLRNTGKPTAVLDESGGYRQPDIVLRDPRFQLFVMAFTATAGTAVGRYLHQLGHRTVAFFGESAGGLYVRNRLAGLRRHLHDNGRGTVRPLWVDAAPWPGDGDRGPATEATAPVRQFLTQLHGVSRNPHRNRLEQDARMLAWLHGPMRERLLPLASEALAMREVTAWVAANDSLAFVLLDFLARRRVRTPQDLSVVGFDDMELSLGAGLTSYNFNMPAVVDAMLAHVLAGAPRSSRARPQQVEVSGYVVARATSGPARPDRAHAARA